MMLTMMLAAISVAYAPSSTNEYYFAKPPADAFATITARTFNRDYNNTAYKLPLDTPGIRYMGAWRRCPITGDPFGGLYKHEALAWINEALAERSALLNGGTNATQTSWSECSFGVRENLAPSFAFTNRMCKANPTGTGILAYDAESDKSPGKSVDFIRNALGGDSSAVVFTFSPSTNAVAGKLIKMGDMEPVVAAIQSIGTAAKSHAGTTLSSWVSNTMRRVIHERGQEQSGDFNGHTYTSSVTLVNSDYIGKPYAGNYFMKWHWFEKYKRTFYLTGWSDSLNRFTSSSEAPVTHTYWSEEHESLNSPRVAVYIGVSSNMVFAGGYNRIQSVKLVHEFRVEQGFYKKEKGDFGSFIKWVYVPDGCVIKTAKDARAEGFEVPSHVHDEGVCAVSSTDISTLPANIMSACGAEWKAAPSADTPQSKTFEDFNKGEWTLVTYEDTDLWQHIYYANTYAFVTFTFRMK